MDAYFKNIAILGATSHIAKGLIFEFNRQSGYQLFLFARSEKVLEDFLRNINCKGNVLIKNFNEFSSFRYDIVINCIGAGDPSKIKEAGGSIMSLTEGFDNLILKYLETNTGTLYVNFSSGSVYGSDFSSPVDDKNCTAVLNMGNIAEGDYYRIAKINSEAKHRAMKELNIVDLRIFSYFSRFIELKSSFFLSEILSCIKNGRSFFTDSKNMHRDYIHMHDLYSLVEKCSNKRNINDAFDVYSKKPVSKFEVLDYFTKNFRFEYTINNNFISSTITGVKEYYYSISRRAEITGYMPQYSSLDNIMEESQKILCG